MKQLSENYINMPIEDSVSLKKLYPIQLYESNDPTFMFSCYAEPLMFISYSL